MRLMETEKLKFSRPFSRPIRDSNGWAHWRCYFIHALLIMVTWLYLRFLQGLPEPNFAGCWTIIHWLTWQMMTTSPQRSQVTKVYGFPSTSKNPKTTKLGEMVNQHAIILPCMYNTLPKLGHMTCFYGFISISIRPITNKHASR